MSFLLAAFLLLGCLVPTTVPLSAAPPEPRYAGRTLESALLDLRARGLKIIFTSNVVRPDMQVQAEPSAAGPRQVLEQLLAPHGLTAREGPNGVLVVVPRPAPPPVEKTAEAPPEPDPMLVIRDEIHVIPSRISLLEEEPASRLGLSRGEILALPHLGDDVFRALTLLPGVTANDVTAQFHVRGGRRDETQILVDGQELFEPFHLKDLDSPLSVVAPATLSAAELSTGAYPVRYGDRMSGVLDMTTLTPTGAPRARLGASILGFHAGGAGELPGERGAWLAEARRDTSDLLSRLLGDEAPDYWDAFGKLDYRLSSRHSLRANLLHSGDKLDIEEIRSEERKHFESENDSSYVWLTHQALLGTDLLLESAAFRTGLDRDRRGMETEEDVFFDILDERDAEIAGLRQAFSFQAAPRHLIEAGWQLREFDTEYRYFGTRELDDPLARIRHDFGTESTVFAGRFRERDVSVYAADRVRLREPLTLELGLRYDRYSQTRESHLSPRLNLAWAVAENSVLRLAWGRFDQSQRPYELQVEDGETGFYPVERSEHRVLGFERLLGRPETALRVELYQRRVDNPRPRYENLFEAFNIFPEVEPDRVRVAPDRSLAEGVELFLRGRLGERAGWWINYAWASIEDEIEGARIPRLFDQTHTVNLDIDIRAGEHWRLNLAWRYHTGWPTTPLTLQETVDEEGEVEFIPVLGAVNSGRLPSYHRLDVRASRRWERPWGALDFFVDIQNLYNRRNLAGFDYEIDEDEGMILVDPEEWPGFLPSLGISVEL
ncbi:MAG TPA: TonB-dependent receptor [Thermoanaerobaculia bacterium]